MTHFLTYGFVRAGLTSVIWSVRWLAIDVPSKFKEERPCHFHAKYCLNEFWLRFTRSLMSIFKNQMTLWQTPMNIVYFSCIYQLLRISRHKMSKVKSCAIKNPRTWSFRFYMVRLVSRKKNPAESIDVVIIETVSGH